VPRQQQGTREAQPDEQHHEGPEDDDPEAGGVGACPAGGIEGIVGGEENLGYDNGARAQYGEREEREDRPVAKFLTKTYNVPDNKGILSCYWCKPISGRTPVK